MHGRTRQRRRFEVYEGLLRGYDVRRRDGEQGHGVALNLLALARLRCIPEEWSQCAVQAEGFGWGCRANQRPISRPRRPGGGRSDALPPLLLIGSLLPPRSAACGRWLLQESGGSKGPALLLGQSTYRK